MLHALFTEKYSPKKLDDVIGNDDGRKEMKTWALEFERDKIQKPLLIYGPPGIGKTSSVRALANEMEWTLIETNASDVRDPESLRKAIGENSRGLFNQRRLILLDEIDGAFDRGEDTELTRVLKENQQPIILTANDAWDKHLANIRPLCKQIEFKKVNTRGIADLLQRIAIAEQLKVEKLNVDAIAKGCGGDVRSALIDLQSGASDSGSRDREANVFEAVRIVFKTSEYTKSIAASENLDIDLDLFTKWIEENIPIEYELSEDKAKAFSWLAKSDIMQQRIRERQYWGLLRYVRAYSHGGVSLSKKEMYHKFTPYQFPSLLRVLSASKGKRSVLKSICNKIGDKMHCSSAKVIENLFLMANAELSTWAELDEDEAKLLKNFSIAGNEFKPDKDKKRKYK